MNDEWIADLAALEVEAEKACRAAYRKRKTMQDAVNWADLHVVSVEQVAQLYRGELQPGFFRVWIEEAAPDSYLLCQYVIDYLAKRGFPDVEVKTEW
jgi:hypothetical protein